VSSKIDQQEGRHSERNEWAAQGCVLWCAVAVAATHPVLRKLDSNVGFRNSVWQECCEFRRIVGRKDAT
jgi:DNA polymerase III psi subunit